MKRAMIVALVIAGVVAIAGYGKAAVREGTVEATPETAASGLGGAVAWLKSQQADDGGFAGFSGESDPGATIDVIIALAAAEDAGVDTGTAIDDAVSYLGSGDIALVYAQTGVGQASKLVLGLIAAGQDPAAFAHVDPLSIVLHGTDDEVGVYGAGVFDHALAVLALTASGNEVPEAAIGAFGETQAENGGWAFDASTDPDLVDSNTTAISLLAIVAAGQGETEMVASGLAYLESLWTDGGAGYSHLPDTLPDANSTALVVQAFAATGEGVSDRQTALATFQNTSGAFHYNATDQSDNLFATVQAIPAMALSHQSDVATPVNLVDALAA